MSIYKKISSFFSLKEFCLILCIILFAGFIRIPSLTQPLGPDQSIMAVIGEGVLRGEIPYRDYWEMGSPAIFFTYALMFKVFGVSMAAIPIADTLMSMLTTLLIFLLARSISGSKVGYISALLFAFFSNGVRLGMHAGGDVAFGTFWYIAQRETFMLPLMVAAFYFILKADEEQTKYWKLVLSGFLSGLAFVFKFPSLIIFICLILHINVSVISKKGGISWKRLAGKNIILILGFVLALVPFTLFFLAKGAMRDMIDVIFKYVFSVYGQTQHNYLGILKMALANTFFVAKEHFVLWILAFTSGIYILKNERRRENILIVIWSLASLLFIASHREFFGYHYLVMLPPFSILAGYGIVKALGPHFVVRKIFSAEFGKAFIIFTILANLAIFSALNFMHYTKAYYYLTEKISKEEYYAFFNAFPQHDYSFPADYEVAQYITKHTDKDDMIYVLGGIESIIYFLSERKSPSRFIFSWFLFSTTHGQGKHAQMYRDELWLDLQLKTPKYIVTIRPLKSFSQFPKLYNFIKNNYLLEKKFPDERFLYASN